MRARVVALVAALLIGAAGARAWTDPIHQRVVTLAVRLMPPALQN